MKHYFHVVYTADGRESRDAIVGVDNLDPETPISGFRTEISKVIAKVLIENLRTTDVHVRRFWDLGIEVDFINVLNDC